MGVRLTRLTMMVCGLAACGGADTAGREQTEAPLPEPETVSVERTLEVYFTAGDSTVPVERVQPVEPPVDPSAAVRPPLEAAIRALLRGPTPDERSRGLTSWFSDETAGTLLSAELDTDGHAILDFTGLPQLIPGASSSAGSEQLLEQLYGTVFQFPEVRSAEYRLDGSCEVFWNWIQRGCTIVRREGGAGIDAEGGPA